MKIVNVSRSVLLIITFVVYSCSSIFSKSASVYEFLSLKYLFFLGGVLCSMAIYAVLWQKELSFLPLNQAYLLKSSTILMILAISHFMFSETITFHNIIGALFIMAGIFMLTWEK